jgi:hypothetical protein
MTICDVGASLATTGLMGWVAFDADEDVASDAPTLESTLSPSSFHFELNK